MMTKTPEANCLSLCFSNELHVELVTLRVGFVGPGCLRRDPVPYPLIRG